MLSKANTFYSQYLLFDDCFCPSQRFFNQMCHLCWWRTANTGICSPFCSEGSLACHTYCDTDVHFEIISFQSYSFFYERKIPEYRIIWISFAEFQRRGIILRINVTSLVPNRRWWIWMFCDVPVVSSGVRLTKRTFPLQNIRFSRWIVTQHGNSTVD